MRIRRGYSDGMSATDPMTPEPCRFSIRLPRPLWISLSTFMLIVVATAIGIGAPIYRQRAAFREIARLDGLVITESRGPEWLRERLGDHWREVFDKVVGVEVVEVGLDYSDATDATLGEIRWLTGLKSLSLEGTQITDASLRNVTDLTRLQTLVLRGTQITDEGTVHLKGIKHLQHLVLSGTMVTDAGLAELTSLTALEHLELCGTRVTDAGLAQLEGLIRLKELWLDDTPISDAGLIHLGRLEKLSHLSMCNTLVTAVVWPRSRDSECFGKSSTLTTHR